MQRCVEWADKIVHPIWLRDNEGKGNDKRLYPVEIHNRIICDIIEIRSVLSIKKTSLNNIYTLVKRAIFM